MSVSSQKQIAKLKKETEAKRKEIEQQQVLKENLERKIEQCHEKLKTCKDTEREDIEVDLKRKTDWHRRVILTLQSQPEELAAKEKELKLLEHNVRPRPAVTLDKGKRFLKCNGGHRCRGEKCTYAHSELEQKTWNAQLFQDEHKEACFNVIEEKINIPILLVRMNFLGLPRSGKTTFLKRLIGMIVNIQQEQEGGNDEEPSTGVAERQNHVFVTKMGMIEGETWTLTSDVDQLAKIVGHIIFQADQQASPKSSEEFTAEQHNNSQSGNTDQGHLPVKKQGHYDIDALYSVYEKAIKDDDWGQMKILLRDAALIINTDTGGQTEFLELLSRFLLGSSSLNLIFTKLTNPLDKPYEISSTDQYGFSNEKEDSVVTAKDVLFQGLACVASLRSTSLNMEQCDGSKPKVLLVGTFKDEVTDENKIEELDKALQDVIKTTSFYKDNMILYPGKNKIILAVNNHSGDKNEIRHIRQTLKDLMDKCFTEVLIPIHWLMFNLSIQNEQSPVLSFVKCKRLASKLKIDVNELPKALNFLHDSVGTLFYYPEISDFFKDNIICNTKVIFDAATRLIVDTFVCNKVNQPVVDIFNEKAQFTLTDLRNALKKDKKDDFLIPMEENVQLLKHLKILAVMKRRHDSRNGREEEIYFMPCILKGATSSKLHETSCPEAAPLVIRYDCGYVPLGMFCSMVISLVSEDDWELDDQKMYRNKIQFQFGSDYSIITLIGRPDYLEVILTDRNGKTIPVKKTCNDVRQTIDRTLMEVASYLNYHSSTSFKFGFKCECDSHSPERVEHLCVMEKSLRCLKTKRVVPRQVSQEVWFELEMKSHGTGTSFDLPIWNEQLKLMTHFYLMRYYDPSTGEKKKLRILDDLSADWKEVGDILGFTPQKIKTIENPGASRTQSDCLRDIFTGWMENADNMLNKKRFPSNWKGVYNLLEDCQHGTTSKDLKAAIEATYSDLHQNFDDAPEEGSARAVSTNTVPVSIQEPQQPSQHMPKHQDQPTPRETTPQTKSTDKKKKMNKDRLAEWLKDQGVDEDDIIYLKSKGVTEILFLKMKRGDKYTSNLSEATVEMLPDLQDELRKFQI